MNSSDMNTNNVPPGARSGEALIGSRAMRVDAREKVMGKAQYPADLYIPGMLYGRILRSPHPHARIRSIERVAAERGVARVALDDTDLSLLGHDRELEVLRVLSTLPDVLRSACADRTPHRVTTWVRELAGAVHGFYHDCYVLGDEIPPPLTQARLWLVEAAAVGLAIGLDLLGVGAPDSM